jgi:methionyl-tRNA synthetase
MPGSIGDVRLSDLHWGKLAPGQKVGKVAGVFPRLDAKIAIPQMQELELKERERQAAIFALPQAAAATPATQADSGKIAIDDFVKVDMRVGLVLAAERVKGADKLLHLTVEIGEQTPRSIVAGIAEAYAPEQLIGRKVAIVANLQPRKLRGLESDGMIVAASIEGGKPVLAGFLEDVPVGARLK